MPNKKSLVDKITEECHIHTNKDNCAYCGFENIIEDVNYATYVYCMGCDRNYIKDIDRSCTREEWENG
jgi:hypothetical protein